MTKTEWRDLSNSDVEMLKRSERERSKIRRAGKKKKRDQVERQQRHNAATDSLSDTLYEALKSPQEKPPTEVHEDAYFTPLDSILPQPAPVSDHSNNELWRPFHREQSIHSTLSPEDYIDFGGQEQIREGPKCNTFYISSSFSKEDKLED